MKCAEKTSCAENTKGPSTTNEGPAQSEAKARLKAPVLFASPFSAVTRLYDSWHNNRGE